VCVFLVVKTQDSYFAHRWVEVVEELQHGGRDT
jgi:hypothetical protein